MIGRQAIDRTVLHVGGADATSFLQGLVTTDVSGLGEDLGYSALLTPQGKYLYDFFVQRADGGFRLDVAAEKAAALANRLTMYRLRADVTVEGTGESVFLVLAQVPQQTDPRHPALGSRLYRKTAPDDFTEDLDFADTYAGLCVRHGIARTGIELTEDSYILEAGFERLGGVDFKKGCYVGQEVTARMRHKTELRKGLAQVRVEGKAPAVGTKITLADGREAGTLFGSHGGLALAHLRFDRVADELQAGNATVKLVAPVWDLD